jgi:hypothetical protein
MSVRFERQYFHHRDSVSTTDLVYVNRGNTDDVSGLDSVSINGWTLPRRVGDSEVWRIEEQGPVVPVDLDGRPNAIHFHRRGLPSFVDSVLSPTQTRILYPTASDTISLSQGAEISWAHSGATSNLLFYALRQGDKRGFSTCCYADEGRIMVRPDLLSSAGLEPGPAELTVSRYVQRDTLSPDGQRYTIVLMSTETVVTNVVP